MELNGPFDFRPKQLRKNITSGVAYICVCSLSEEEIQLLQVYHSGDWPDVRLKKEAELTIEGANELVFGELLSPSENTTEFSMADRIIFHGSKENCIILNFCVSRNVQLFD